MSEITKAKLIIIGSGPAGYSAAIYAARANLEPIMITGYDAGGQLTTTTDVENYPGFAQVIQGPWLMEQMKLQAEHVGTKIIFDYISKVDFSKRPFRLEAESGAVFEAEAVIISTGAQAKWLGTPSESLFRGFGISGCATCDAFFYRGKEVIVVGGGNTAVEEALYLTNHASKVYLVHRRDSLKAEKILQDRLFSNPKVTPIWNAEIDEFLGTHEPKSLNAVRLKSTKDGSLREMKIDGVFVAIGHKPATAVFVNSGLEMDSEGYILTKPGTPFTNIPGVFAAGDVQDKTYRQAVTAAGTGCMAALDAQRFLEA
jgi:thioredoxin reductase (NADPH)